MYYRKRKLPNSDNVLNQRFLLFEERQSNLFKDEFLTGLKSETEVVETSKDCKFVRY